MKLQRPIVPSRWLERICFGAGALVIVVIGSSGLWAARRGLIEWQEVPNMVLAMSFGALPALAAGYIIRRWRLKKAREMREYEHILATVLDGG